MSKPTKKELQSIHLGDVLIGEKSAAHRLGFMQGEITVPDDFDLMEKDKIAHLFETTTISTRGYHFNRDTENER